MKEGKKRQGFMSGLSRLITMKNVLFHSSLSLEKDSPLKLWLKKKRWLSDLYSLSAIVLLKEINLQSAKNELHQCFRH